LLSLRKSVRRNVQRPARAKSTTNCALMVLCCLVWRYKFPLYEQSAKHESSCFPIVQETVRLMPPSSGWHRKQTGTSSLFQTNFKQGALQPPLLSGALDSFFGILPILCTTGRPVVLGNRLTVACITGRSPPNNSNTSTSSACRWHLPGKHHLPASMVRHSRASSGACVANGLLSSLSFPESYFLSYSFYQIGATEKFSNHFQKALPHPQAAGKRSLQDAESPASCPPPKPNKQAVPRVRPISCATLEPPASGTLSLTG